MNFLKKQAFIKITIITTLFSFIILGTYLHGVYTKIENNYIINIEKHNELQYNIIEKNLLNTKKDILYIASVYNYFLNNKKYSYDENLEFFTQDLKRISQSRKVYSQIRFVNNSGQEVVRVDNKNNKTIIIKKENLQDKSNRYYFKESKTLKDGEIYLSQFDLNVENGKIEIPYNPTIRISTPVTNADGKISGYILINYLGDEILKELKLSSIDINSLLLNKDSYYMLGFKSSDEWGFMFNKNISFQNDYPKGWAKINSSNVKHSIALDENNKLFAFRQINPVDIISPNRETLSRRNWTIISYIHKEKILLSFYNFIDSIKYLTIAFGLIIFAFAYIISQYVKKLQEEGLRVEIADEVFKNTMEGILVLNSDRKVIQTNHGFERISGYKESEIIGKNPSILHGKHGESKEFYKKLWKSVINENFWNGELTNQHKNGQKYISKLAIGVVKRDKKIVYYIGVFSDITKQSEDKKKLKNTALALEKSLNELKNAQNKLIESEKLTALGQLIAGVSHEINSPLGAIKSSSDNILQSLNNIIKNIPKLALLLNEDEKETLLKLKSNLPLKISILSIKDERILRKRLVEQLDSIGVENSRYFADKFSQFNIDDITPYKNLITHKSAHFIIDVLYDEYLTISNIHNIIRAVNRASKTIYALKKFAHFDHDREGVIERVENSLDDILILFSHNLKQGIEVTKNYTSLDAIFCYPDELSQVWMNLISNAIHAMDNQGKLEISTSENTNYQIISIKDSGCGIPQELQKKIFNPFFTTKKSGEGSGLGLDIVKKIVDAHNGKIDLQSDEHGTIITVYLSKNIKGETK
ncbi:PAS domain-containing sensor histidine kinase [uncultured Arcobacter sp.]|uniref:PAS domain-containing sensor histidine kinase n=1 Tax=uncultured Arcobacter sp. TaxID=165434 RepID=UPI002634A4DA|nr:PAS domain-containing sensor histidine kinase [uncultured Arcobacter sp.]